MVNSIYRLVFLMEAHCDICEVGYEFSLTYCMYILLQ